jgi:AraC-like DNA-binding protein
MIGVAFVQARALSGTGPVAREQPGTEASVPLIGARRCGVAWRELEPMSRADFSESARLLQLVFQHVETSALADLRKSDLAQAQQALVELQTVATRLRGELNGLVPAFKRTGLVLQGAKHPEHSVRAALACIFESYSQGVTLKQCAEHVGLNAAYLSALFSRSVGVPFKTYLTEVRMEKARELLSDPAKTVSDVAFAVGYASENRFRSAFRHVTGLSPSMWRQTWRMQGTPARSGLLTEPPGR